MFQNYIKKQVKNLHEFPVTSAQIRLIMNAFFLSKFGYYLLVCKFQSRSLNNRINRLQDRTLRLVYKGTSSSIIELLKKENTFTIHQKKIKKRATEIYKVKQKIPPGLIYELFQETEHPYNLLINHTFRTYSAETVQHGTGILLFMGPKIRSLFPSNRNNSETLEIFKQKTSY